MDIIILDEYNKQVEWFERELAGEKDERMRIYLSGMLGVLVGNRDLLESSLESPL
jgi:hypothetical protein